MTGTAAVDGPLPFPFPQVDPLTPPPRWTELRDRCPIAPVRLPSGAEALLLTRYDDVRAFLVDPAPVFGQTEQTARMAADGGDFDLVSTDEVDIFFKEAGQLSHSPDVGPQGSVMLAFGFGPITFHTEDGSVLGVVDHHLMYERAAAAGAADHIVFDRPPSTHVGGPGRDRRTRGRPPRHRARRGPARRHRAGRRPPLVLVPGSLQAGAALLPLDAHLAGHHTCWVLDRRGYGGSTDAPATYDIRREYADVAAVAATAGRDVTVLGYSFGAVCALGAATTGTPPGRLVLFPPTSGRCSARRARPPSSSPGTGRCGRARTGWSPPCPTPGPPSSTPATVRPNDAGTTPGWGAGEHHRPALGTRGQLRLATSVRTRPGNAVGATNLPVEAWSDRARVRRAGGGTAVRRSTGRGVLVTDFRDRAACRDVDPELFFPLGDGGPAQARVDAAKAVCRRCPVRLSCLDLAMSTGQDEGVWGGLDPRERRRLRRVRRAA